MYSGNELYILSFICFITVLLSIAELVYFLYVTNKIHAAVLLEKVIISEPITEPNTVHRSSPHDPILRPIYPVHTLTTYSAVTVAPQRERGQDP
jgi:hypothetical protein